MCHPDVTIFSGVISLDLEYFGPFIRCDTFISRPNRFTGGEGKYCYTIGATLSFYY